MLHPSRVVRFLGNEAPDPSLAGTVWSDSVLLALYDAIHAVALTMAGATSLMHEAKVDIVTVPNLSEHLSSSETTAQLSARFGTAAAMKSINNLLLLGDRDTWNRQKVDFAGLPEMVRTFLQVAAGAADIPVTRLLGQSPAGLSATGGARQGPRPAALGGVASGGDSDTRNYYDLVSARQEADLRPKLERLDRLIAASEGLDPDAQTFDFRPLWQLDAATAATVALQKAQATQVYAGLDLWPAAVMARLVQAQFVEDGTYPNAAAVFAEDEVAGVVTDIRGVTDMPMAPLSSPPSAGRHEGEEQPRDWHGRYASWGDETDAADPSSVGEDPHAPDGTPVTPAMFGKKRGGRYGKGHGPRSGRSGAAILGSMARFLRRWWPEEPESDEPDTSLAPAKPDAPSQTQPETEPKPAISEQSIQFGNNAEQHYHAFRHVDEAGLDRSAVESAIRNDLASRPDRIQSGLNQGSVEVSGKKLNYNAFMFPDGEINVGRITISR